MIILMGIIFSGHSLSGDAAAPPNGTLVPTVATCNANNMRITNTTTLVEVQLPFQAPRPPLNLLAWRNH